MRKILQALFDFFTNKKLRAYIASLEYPDGLYGWLFNRKIISYRNMSAHGNKNIKVN